MAFVTTNNLDDIAIYLGANRLPGELNNDFLARIKRLANTRYGTDQKVLAKSIINQIGLLYNKSISLRHKDPFTISIKDNLVTVQTYPITGGKYIKVFIGSMVASGDNSTYPLRKVISILENNEFVIDVLNEDLLNSTKENILSLSNFENKQYIIESKSTRMDALSILPNSIYSTSQSMRNRVYNLQDLKSNGDYYFDETLKYLELFDNTPNPFIMSYIEYDPIFTMLVSEFNLLSPANYSRYGLSDNFINIVELALRNRGIGSYE